MIEKKNRMKNLDFKFQIYYNTNIAKSFAQNLGWRQNIEIVNCT